MQVDERRLSGLVRGVLGGVAGLLAMRLATEAGRALAGDGGDEGGGGGAIERSEALDDVAIGELRTREGEPAPATLGRLAYRAVEGSEPDEDTRRRLGRAVHWGYGVLMGGAYGAVRPDAEIPDTTVGLGFGLALWLVGDEIVVPLLGLAGGPTAHRWTDHATALGAHLVYGATTAAATQALARAI